MKQITIPKDQAVFRLDGNGRWHNRFGPFEHAKIINHFHTSIRKDDQGFHLCQEHEGVVEKVYFPYEDTALFVFEVDFRDPAMVTLNTGRKLALQPENLFVVGDCMYLRIDGDRAKFTDRCLIKMAPLLSYEGDQYVLKINGQSFVVSDNSSPDGPV
ncbi:MAG: MFS transporter permease [Desulfobacteraceae bacterium]|jgi:hypothetical protein